MVGDREKAIAAGCDDYDTKPIDFPRLLDKIEKILAKAAR
jgi:CheY-like chemotaxis protein